jgi:hypothetical protein
VTGARINGREVAAKSASVPRVRMLCGMYCEDDVSATLEPREKVE